MFFQQPLQTEYAEAVAIGQEYLARLIKEARTGGADVVVVYLPWRGEVVDQEWERFVGPQRQNGAHLFVRKQPEQFARTTATANGAVFVSLVNHASTLASEHTAQLWHVETDAHLSTEGNRILGELLVTAVEDALRKRTSPSVAAAK